MGKRIESFWLDSVRDIRADRTHGQIAPYKALLLLWMIARVANGESSSISFREAEPPLIELMGGYVLGKTLRVHYPFVYLAGSSDLWKVNTARGDDIYKMITPIPPHRRQPARENRLFLLDHAIGSLTPSFSEAVQNTSLRSKVVDLLLNLHLVASSHVGVLETLGLSRKVRYAARLRDPKFVSDVHAAYEEHCAFCGFDIKLKAKPVAIECAHIQWHSRAGPEKVENGLLLCSLHHRLFDVGALGIDEDRKILVSTRISAVEGAPLEALQDLAGLAVRAPKDGYLEPSLEFVRWHRKEVFVA